MTQPEGAVVQRRAHEASLQRAEAELAQVTSRCAETLYARASALDALGRQKEALQSYVELLHFDRRHLRGLLGAAAALFRAQRREAATQALMRAVEAWPACAVAHANLGTALADVDAGKAIASYERALALDPDNGPAHRGLAVQRLRQGDHAIAARHGRAGFGAFVESWPFRGQGQPVTVLVVQSALGGNVPVELFLDDRVFLRRSIPVEFFDPSQAVPAYDVVFNVVGDGDRCDRSMDAAARVVAHLARSGAPVLNAPEAVRASTRAGNAARRARIPRRVTPALAPRSREALRAADAPRARAEAGHRWPLLLRAPGFHTGEHFAKVDGPGELAAAVASLPGDHALVLEYVDTRSPDGLYRKYRAMTIDGRLHPLHLAVSPRWKVHYFSADMADRADHRAEDEAFLRDMPAAIGPDAMRALEAAQATLGARLRRDRLRDRSAGSRRGVRGERDDDHRRGRPRGSLGLPPGAPRGGAPRGHGDDRPARRAARGHGGRRGRVTSTPGDFPRRG